MATGFPFPSSPLTSRFVSSAVFTMVSKAFASSAALFASRRRPADGFTMHSSWETDFLSIPNPTTWIFETIPFSARAFAAAQGSPPQLSSPSVTRMITLLPVKSFWKSFAASWRE